MMSVGRRLAPLLLAALAWSMTGQPAYAVENETFGVTPHPQRVGAEDRVSFSIPLETGVTFEDAFRIWNRTNEQLSLTVYAADAETADDGTITVGLRTDRPRGVASWIDLARSDIELSPREEVIVNFSIEVRSSDPIPNLGAIVVESVSAGLASNASERLHLRVLSAPPNTPTTSNRVRPLVFQSPWLALAVAGLVLTVVLIVIGAMRARRPKDVVVPAGEIALTVESESDDLPEGSRPVIKRLGRPDEEDEEDDHSYEESEEEPMPTTRLRRAAEHLGRRASAGGRRASKPKRDPRPLLDDELLTEVPPGDTAERKRAPAPLEPLESEEEDFQADDETGETPAPTERKGKPSGRKASPRRTPGAASSTARKSSARKSSSRKATSRKATSRKKPASRKRSSPAKTEDFIPLSDL